MLDVNADDKLPDAPDADDLHNRLLTDFCQLINTDPGAVDNWLRDHAPADVVRRLAQMTGDHDRPMAVAQSTSATLPHNGSPKRTASVTSELFQQWLNPSSSAAASPRRVN